MPQCMHEGHKGQTATFKTFKKEVQFVSLTMGWNPIHQRFEHCDAGLIPPRKPGKKKELRHGGTEEN